MSVTFAVPTSRKAEYAILPEDIKIKSELNGREHLPDVQEMINSILTVGQLTPVTIRKDGDKPVLVAGFSRWRAVTEINRLGLAGKGIKMHLRCSYVQLNDHQAFLANITENRFRNDVTPIDDAHNIQRLLNVYNMTEQAVAAFYFPLAKSEKELKEAMKFVRDRVALISLTAEAAEAVRTGRVKENAATAIAKLSEEAQREALKKEGEITRKDLKPAKVAKPIKYNNDPELIRRATQVVNDCRGGLDGKEEYLDVTRTRLVELDQYLELLKGSK